MGILSAEASLRTIRRLAGTIHIVPPPWEVSNPGTLIKERLMRFITHAPRTKHRVPPASAIALALALAALPARAAAPEDVTPEQAYQLAREARTERDYAGMLAMLRRAGEAGDLNAQELLAGVLLAGPALYGPAIAADPCEAERWARRAAAQGSQVARHHAELFNVFASMDGPAFAAYRSGHARHAATDRVPIVGDGTHFRPDLNGDHYEQDLVHHRRIVRFRQGPGRTAAGPGR
ncbi:MAG: hypothetical protein QM674_19940 [Burkholderiaceae bacterium]